MLIHYEHRQCNGSSSQECVTHLILNAFYSHLQFFRSLSVQAKIFLSGNLFHNENISKKI